MSFKEERRTVPSDAESERTERLHSADAPDRELRGQDDLPLWGRESSREDFIEGHYGPNSAPGSAATTGRGRAVSQGSATPSSRVGEELTPMEPTAAQSSRGDRAEHERLFDDPRPMTPSGADTTSSGSSRRRTDVVTFSDAANAHDRITIGEDSAARTPETP